VPPSEQMLRRLAGPGKRPKRPPVAARGASSDILLISLSTVASSGLPSATGSASSGLRRWRRILAALSRYRSCRWLQSRLSIFFVLSSSLRRTRRVYSMVLLLYGSNFDDQFIEPTTGIVSSGSGPVPFDPQDCDELQRVTPMRGYRVGPHRSGFPRSPGQPTSRGIQSLGGRVCSQDCVVFTPGEPSATEAAARSSRAVLAVYGPSTSSYSIVRSAKRVPVRILCYAPPPSSGSITGGIRWQ